MINISRGSEWRRWEPHIHAPGTVLNNQFKRGWDAYLEALNNQTPKIEAVAVTDYYVTDTYEKLQEYKKAGRLPEIPLLFPNIEMRLTVSSKKSPVNMHLLVNPEDPDHLPKVKGLLELLTFEWLNETFNCTREGLINLGKHDTTITDEIAALKHGVDQFKVDFKQLRDVIGKSEWARDNILIAVSGGSNDGTSSMRGAYSSVRRGIEKFADIVFSSNPTDREFWLGRGKEPPKNLRKKYGGCKPCLHGSDAHKLKSVGQPDGNRFCWIKGDLTFDALRHACINPEGRTYVGEQPPHSATPSQVISHVKINNAQWAGTPEIPLNPGLVAIIGARGSGKTALADVIAAGCDVVTHDSQHAGRQSFLARARPLLGEAETTLTWGNDEITTRRLDGSDANDGVPFQRAQYLSQQFVEELCSDTGTSSDLVKEIERVIFKSHSQDVHDKAPNFAELRDQKTALFRQARKRESEAIGRISEHIAAEMEKENLIANLSAQIKGKKKLIEGYVSGRAKFAVKGTQEQIDKHARLSKAAQDIMDKIQGYESRIRALVTLQGEVKSMRDIGSPEMLREVRARHPNSGLSDEQWGEFSLVYKGDVDEILANSITLAENAIRELKGDSLSPDDAVAPISSDTDISKLSLAPIVAEMKRLDELFGADKIAQKKLTALTDRIKQENSALRATEALLIDAKGANARRNKLQAERNAIYERIFKEIISEQLALDNLYKPLAERLTASSGTLAKLKFSVNRNADIEVWGAFAEKHLLDLRRSGPFQGRGSLIDAATQTLKPAWETGNASEIRSAMKDFIDEYSKGLLSHALCDRAQQDEFRDWSKRFAHWLFGTDHITVRYEMSYNGIDIRKLSPGMRGIVLLLLYLDLDDSDDRPLIIDQPEENLDPKSVFNELVNLFIAAKAKRQVIIVTHNANLVVNTDADQVIVAEADPRTSEGLPSIRYTAGGLENADIRKAVCDILEGGEAAFHERARRLHVRLE